MLYFSLPSQFLQLEATMIFINSCRKLDGFLQSIGKNRTNQDDEPYLDNQLQLQ